jgi:hypothetical protein
MVSERNKASRPILKPFGAGITADSQSQVADREDSNVEFYQTILQDYDN